MFLNRNKEKREVRNWRLWNCKSSCIFIRHFWQRKKIKIQNIPNWVCEMCFSIHRNNVTAAHHVSLFSEQSKSSQLHEKSFKYLTKFNANWAEPNGAQRLKSMCDKRNRIKWTLNVIAKRSGVGKDQSGNAKCDKQKKSNVLFSQSQFNKVNMLQSRWVFLLIWNWECPPQHTDTDNVMASKSKIVTAQECSRFFFSLVADIC